MPAVAVSEGGAACPALGEVLSGEVGVEPVRRVVLDPWGHGLGPALDRALPGGPRGRLQVLRSKFKPGRKLSAWYEMESSGGPVHLAATWAAPLAGAAGHAVSVAVSPADPTMPQLTRLSDPRHLADGVGRLTGGREWTSGALRVETIRYRPGERHVLRVALGRSREAVVVKTDRDGSGERAVPVARAVTALLRSACPEVSVAEPLGWLPDDAASVWALAPGRPLSHGVVELAAGTTRDVMLLGRALRSLHDDSAMAEQLRVSGCVLPSLEVASELAGTRRATEHIRVLLPLVGAVADRVVSSAAAALAAHGQVAPSVVHGDLKCDNVLTGNGLRVLDLDRAGLGDPAIDLAKLVADLHWWLPRDPGSAGGLVRALRGGYGAGAEDRWSRAEALVPVFLLRFAARRCAVHDRDWAVRVEALVHDAAAMARTAAP